MEKRSLGRTGLNPTVLGYGAMALRDMDMAGSEKLLNALLDEGINFIDTAPDYGPSEEMIGHAISNRRDEYFLASKCGCNVPRVGDGKHIWTGKQLLHNIELSLQRLKTDYLDIWQVHSAYPDELTGTDVLQTMYRVKEEGKVRHIAISMAGASDGHGYVQLKPYLDWEQWEAFQIWYGAFVRYSEDLIQKAADLGRGLIVRGLVRPPNDTTTEACFEAAGLDDLRANDESRAQFVLRFGLAHPGLSTAIVGTSQMDHLKDNIAAATRGPLAPDVLAAARARLDAAGYTVGM